MVCHFYQYSHTETLDNIHLAEGVFLFGQLAQEKEYDALQTP